MYYVHSSLVYQVLFYCKLLLRVNLFIQVFFQVVECDDVVEDSADLENLRAHLASVLANKCFDQQCIEDTLSIFARVRFFFFG